MNKNSFYLIGVMSGTSLDGVDLAYIHFVKDENWSFKIITAQTIAYSSVWVKKLSKAINLKKKEIQNLNVLYTQLLSEIINNFISDNNIVQIDAVCSHGHTILHQPENKLTLQIGNLPVLSKLIKQNVVCDFRVQDVELGGQGAPLVPIGDLLLFSEYDYCINLGGFSNVSNTYKNHRIAYDICPVNIVLNHYVEKIGLSYDDKGCLASKGKVNSFLLKELNGLGYYNKQPPKSLGLEWVNKNIFPLIDGFNLSIEDILRTFVEHIAFQISKSLSIKNSKALFTGGGVYNSFLMERIESLSSIEIIKPDINLIEYKESLIFAFLGLLRMRNEVNVLASVTGAKKNHSSGEIFLNN